MTLIDAAAELLGRRDDVVFLHLGHGALLDAARARVAGLGLQDHYLLPGHQPQVEALFPLFDVFVMSSREEGLGSSVLDAFQARCTALVLMALAFFALASLRMRRISHEHL